LSIKHTGSAVEVTVEDANYPADNDPDFETAATFGNGHMLVRNVGSSREIIVVHTDIEAPDRVPFGSKYSYTVDRDESTTASDTYALEAGDNVRIAASVFPSEANLTKTFVQYTAATPEGRLGQFDGTFAGAAGVYRCANAAGCSVERNAMGKFEPLTDGQWEFTPAAGELVDDLDADYLTYGFWLTTTVKEGAIASYDTVQTFATSSLTPTTNGELSAATGSATYKGDAAGVYVHKTMNDDGSLNVASSGRFTADVDLTAYFEATSLRIANTMSGTISNFDLEHGEANKWEVDLAAGDIATGSSIDGTASGGVTGVTGDLDARFHGSPAETGAAPPVVVGEFNSNFSNGSAAGSFGARRQKR
jgi:hypothetical protein